MPNCILTKYAIRLCCCCHLGILCDWEHASLPLLLIFSIQSTLQSKLKIRILGMSVQAALSAWLTVVQMQNL